MTNSQTTKLVTIQNNLEKLINKKMQALPQNFNQTRFVQNCMVVLQDTKEIEKYDPISVARGLLKGAFLDLDFFNGECYMIPYGKELKFQTDYKGEVKIIKKYSIQKVKETYAKVVKKGDAFQELIENGIQTIRFEPKPFSNAEIVGVFAVCVFLDGSMVYDTMSFEEVEKVRTTYSKQPAGQAWKNSYGEMAKKTVLRRLKKWIPIEFENTDQYKAYEDGGDAQFEEVEVTPAKPKTEEPQPIASEELYDITMELEQIIGEEKLPTGYLKRIKEWLEADEKDATFIKSGKDLIDEYAEICITSEQV